MIVGSHPVFWPVVVLACCFTLEGCEKKSSPIDDRTQHSNPAMTTVDQSTKQEAKQTAHSTKEHDPANPPIDCPLRKQGIDPSHMKPFEDVERYITFLEREDRAVWQKPDEVIAALGLTGNETVVDLGTGSGYFAFRFAKALPRGRVIAADIEPEMIRHIHHKAMSDGVRNIEATLIQADAPTIPSGVDLVFVCDVLHHVADKPSWLSKITNAMPSGGRLVLIEFKEGDLPEGPPESMKIPHDELVKLVTDTGLLLAEENAKLLPYQTFLLFKKP